jgi:acylphosphatase
MDAGGVSAGSSLRRGPGDVSLVRMEATYSTEVDGGRYVRLRYVIEGRLEIAEFLDFVADRAHWFGIDGWVMADDARSVTLVAAGPDAMVGALEMACTLGPITSLIERVEGIEETGPVEAGFKIGQK